MSDPLATYLSIASFIGVIGGYGIAWGVYKTKVETLAKSFDEQRLDVRAINLRTQRIELQLVQAVTTIASYIGNNPDSTVRDRLLRIANELTQGGNET